jgi:uridine kinase
MFLITIDGPAGSGKTTLAEQIHDCISKSGESVATIHMDDLYSGWDHALSPALTDSLKEILKAYEAGRELKIPQYDWVARSFGDPLTIDSPDVLILEGVASGQKITRDSADIKLWIEAPREIAFARVLERDGENIRLQMQQWQIRESVHFLEEGTKSAADYQVKSAP